MPRPRTTQLILANPFRVKRSVLGTLRHPVAQRILRPFVRERATIFMLHRFQHGERGVSGLAPDALRRTLGFLRARRIPIISLGELVTRMARPGAVLTGAVAFTIDDGYADHAEVAAPLFAEYDAPVTTFVTTGFLDGALWFWWDRIEYILFHTARAALTIRVADVPREYQLLEEGDRRRAVADLVRACKGVPDHAKLETILELSETADVELPSDPPPRYAPMSWDDVRRCEGMGMTFGPHTVTHPILSNTEAAQAEYELRESWRRLSAEASAPVPVFCYPNGQAGDFGSREFSILDDLRLAGAVTGRPGYASAAAFLEQPHGHMQIRRFNFPYHFEDVLQIVTGFERAKALVRGGGD